MKNQIQKLDTDTLAKLILGLYDEADKNHIISLVGKNESITPEIEEAIRNAFKKQADEMEKELADLRAEKDEFVEYREQLENETAELEKDLDEDSTILKTDLSEVANGLDKIEEGEKVDENQSQIEALRNKLLNK